MKYEILFNVRRANSWWRHILDYFQAENCRIMYSDNSIEELENRIKRAIETEVIE